MTKQEYQNKRKALIEEAQNLLDEGKLQECEAKQKEIEDLDEQYEKYAKAQANFNTMKDQGVNPTIIDMFFHNGNMVGAGEFRDSSGKEIRAYRKGQLLSNAYVNTEGLSLGKYLKGAITGNWENAVNEMNAFKALSTATTQVLIPQVLSSQVIDIARNKSILFNAGVPMVEMPYGNLTVSRIKTDPTFGFKGEGLEVTEGTMEFEGVNLKAKTAYGLISVTMEAMNSSANLDSIVRNAMGESIARTIDYACLFGSLETEPKGILTYDTINVQAETEALTNYDPFIKAVGKIRKANGEPKAWAINADTEETLNLLKDAQGNPLVIPDVVKNLQREISNQLPNNGGVGQNESTAMIYDPEAMLIGMQIPLVVEISREALDAWKKGLIYLRVYAMLDIALLRPKNICKITGLKAA